MCGSLLAYAVSFPPLLNLFVSATNYGLIKQYQGSTFFDDWPFYDHFDNVTNGDAIFVSASVAASSKLAYVDPTTNHAIIKVDNTSTVPYNQKRNTVRVATSDSFGIGSVWIADMYHCSVWPAWWSQAPSWPIGGEIDTLEGVNLVQHNQMGLHTLPGCTIVSPVQDPSSAIRSPDCSYLSNNNQGCLYTANSTASYGAGLAAVGGGVYVTELADSGISIWFFPRPNVPSPIYSNNTIDTSLLGRPVGNWPSTNCSMDKYFQAQNLIFGITLCGDLAGNPSIYAETCPGVCYNDSVVGNGSNYATAYFEVASVRVFGVNGTNATTSTGNDGTKNNSSETITSNFRNVLVGLFLAGMLLPLSAVGGVL